jgi:YfiR/HmsC-like
LNIAGRGRDVSVERLPRARPRELGRSHSRIRATVLAVFVALPGVRVESAQDSASSEYQVKAAFLFHFAQFVEWPPETLKDAVSPMTYCTIGVDPFHGALDQSLSGKTVRERPLRVQHLTERQEVGGCQVLFIGAVGKKRLDEALVSASGNPILTVGETEHFAKDGGIIGFFLEQNKIRFEINLDAAGKSKLKISAKLLALARTVIGNPRGN